MSKPDPWPPTRGTTLPQLEHTLSPTPNYLKAHSRCWIIFSDAFSHPDLPEGFQPKGTNSGPFFENPHRQGGIGLFPDGYATDS